MRITFFVKGLVFKRIAAIVKIETENVVELLFVERIDRRGVHNGTVVIALFSDLNGAVIDNHGDACLEIRGVERGGNVEQIRVFNGTLLIINSVT